MHWDAINAIFEAGGGVLLAVNVRRLWRDRRLAGVSVWPTVWFTAWGLWNLVYYPALHQWWSLAAGVAVVVGNAAWLLLAAWLWWRDRGTMRPEERVIMKTGMPVSPRRIRFVFDERSLRTLEEVEAAGLEIPEIFRLSPHGSTVSGPTSRTEGATSD